MWMWMWACEWLSRWRRVARIGKPDVGRVWTRWDSQKDASLESLGDLSWAPSADCCARDPFPKNAATPKAAESSSSKRRGLADCRLLCGTCSSATAASRHEKTNRLKRWRGSRRCYNCLDRQWVGVRGYLPYFSARWTEVLVGSGRLQTASAMRRRMATQDGCLSKGEGNRFRTW